MHGQTFFFMGTYCVRYAWKHSYGRMRLLRHPHNQPAAAAHAAFTVAHINISTTTIGDGTHGHGMCIVLSGGTENRPVHSTAL